MRDGVGISGKQMDAFRLLVGSKAAGGLDLVLTSHAYQTPTMSSVFDSEGNNTFMTSKDLLRLSHSPNKSIKGIGSKLEHTKCGHVADPLLTCVSTVPEFGQSHKLLLDRMPQPSSHSFVAFVQLETSFKRRNVETNFYNIVRKQPNALRGGEDHRHDGFSCFFGKHHMSRPNVGDFKSRSPGVFDKKDVSICVVFFSIVYCI